MIKNLTYKKKVQLIIGAFFVFLFIAYKLSISNTILLKNECKLNEEKIAIAENASQNIISLQSKLLLINSKIGSNISEEIDFQEMLMENVSEYCKENNIVFKEMQQTHSYEKGNYIIQTNIFSVEGNYKKLLKLVHNLETKNNSGKIISLKFYSKKDLITKRTRLFLKIYFQNIKQKNN